MQGSHDKTFISIHNHACACLSSWRRRCLSSRHPFTELHALFVHFKRHHHHQHRCAQTASGSVVCGCTITCIIPPKHLTIEPLENWLSVLAEYRRYRDSGWSCRRPRPSLDIDPQSSYSPARRPLMRHGFYTPASTAPKPMASTEVTHFAGRMATLVPAIARHRKVPLA